MFLDEFDKEVRNKFAGKDFIAGWQNKSGKVSVMIIGEAPGMTGAAINRKPLSNSRSGKVLWQILKESEWDKKTIYITNLIKYPLPNNRDPTDFEMNENKPILIAEIEKYNPQVIICLGKFACKVFNLKTYETKVDSLGKVFISINHPGYYIRKPNSVPTAVKFLKDKTHSLDGEEGRLDLNQ